MSRRNGTEASGSASIKPAIDHHLGEYRRRLIASEELPRRSRLFSGAAAERIIRYGGIIGSRIERHPRLERGRDRALSLIRQVENRGGSFASGTVILADELTGGRGRFQRPWHAPPGGLWMTLVLVNTLLPAAARLYPLAAGVACCETIRHYGIPAAVKWVNDILAGGRKVAGILTETRTGPVSGEEYVLLGIGINANNDIFPAELAGTASSMKTLLHHPVDLEELAARLLAKLTWNIGLLHEEEDRRLREDIGPEEEGHPLVERYRELCDSVGRMVIFGFDVQIDPQYEARVVRIDPDGGVVFRLADGRELVEHGGEILYRPH